MEKAKSKAIEQSATSVKLLGVDYLGKLTYNSQSQPNQVVLGHGSEQIEVVQEC